ncbi:MAG: 50S ribosomal protein L18 [Phycisphaeraceae bacterium]|nr:50S ribosomal protein L18 [Phycisphaeraceae bacterium]MCB9847293.1 50S ribosomal protein L18 [Phycisphaeraceae bacterium]
MNKNKLKTTRRNRRRAGIRKRVIGMPDQPRLTVFRSNNHIYAQVIDDMAQSTIASASTRDKGVSISGGAGNVNAARAVGKAIAERARSAGVSKVVFDRGGFLYHGRVRALAEGAREGGLEF